MHITVVYVLYIHHKFNHDKMHMAKKLVLDLPSQSCESSQHPDHDSSLLRMSIGEDVTHTYHLKDLYYC